MLFLLTTLNSLSFTGRTELIKLGLGRAEDELALARPFILPAVGELIPGELVRYISCPPRKMRF